MTTRFTDLAAPLPPELAAAVRELGATLALVRLPPLAEQLEKGDLEPAGWLTGPEMARLAGYRYPKRRLEWLGGRLAAKLALLALETTTASPLHWRIDSAGDGRPLSFLLDQDGERPGPEISISHSHGLAAALVARRPCGLDLQKTTGAVGRVRERFCTPDEAEALAAAGLTGDDLTLLWAAKEALRKGLGGTPLTGFLAMTLTGAEGAGGRQLTLAVGKGKEYKVLTGWLQEHAIAISII